MGMFQSPYDRGGVLSKEAIEERKKIYWDRRSPEIRKKDNIRLFLYFLPLLPLMLLPGFFAKAALSRTAYLMLPYAMEAVAVVLTTVSFFCFLYLSRGGKVRREDGSFAEGAIDGGNYRKYFQNLQGRAAVTCILGIGFLLIEIFYLLLAKEKKNYGLEFGILLIQLGFIVFSRVFWLNLSRVIRNWTL